MSRSRYKHAFHFGIHPDVEKALDEVDLPLRFSEKKDHMFLLLGKQPPILVGSRGKQNKIPPRTIKNCIARIRRAYQTELEERREKRRARNKG